MRLYRVLATSAALAGLTLTLQACTSSTGTTAAPAGSSTQASKTTTEPAAETGSGDANGDANDAGTYDQILAGKRKVLIHIAEDDKDWSATYEGPIAVGTGTDDGALFRIVPAGDDQFMIEALRTREEGGRWCTKGDSADEPVSLGTVKCAENDTTLFKIAKTDQKDDKGRPTHRITNERFGTVQVKNDGSALYIQEVGDGGSRGSFSFVDRGAVE